MSAAAAESAALPTPRAAHRGHRLQPRRGAGSWAERSREERFATTPGRAGGSSRPPTGTAHPRRQPRVHLSPHLSIRSMPSSSRLRIARRRHLRPPPPPAPPRYPRLPSSLAILACHPRLPSSLAILACHPRLPSSRAILGCHPRLPSSPQDPHGPPLHAAPPAGQRPGGWQPPPAARHQRDDGAGSQPQRPAGAQLARRPDRRHTLRLRAYAPLARSRGASCAARVLPAV